MGKVYVKRKIVKKDKIFEFIEYTLGSGKKVITHHFPYIEGTSEEKQREQDKRNRERLIKNYEER